MTATLDARTYRTADVVAFTGATYRQIDYWCRVGLLDPEGDGRGSGIVRRWAPEDVRAALIIAALARLGCEGEPLRAAARWSYANLEQVDAGSLVVSPDIITATAEGGTVRIGAGAWVVPIPPRLQ